MVTACSTAVASGGLFHRTVPGKRVEKWCVDGVSAPEGVHGVVDGLQRGIGLRRAITKHSAGQKG